MEMETELSVGRDAPDSYEVEVSYVMAFTAKWQGRPNTAGVSIVLPTMATFEASASDFTGEPVPLRGHMVPTNMLEEELGKAIVLGIETGRAIAKGDLTLDQLLEDGAFLKERMAVLFDKAQGSSMRFDDEHTEALPVLQGGE
jgi:hypothetical protein